MGHRSRQNETGTWEFLVIESSDDRIEEWLKSTGQNMEGGAKLG